MPAHMPHREDQNQAIQSVPLLHSMSARDLAEFIRSLDSKLVNMRYEEHDSARMLTYTFEVAGTTHIFHLLVTTNVIESIADLYPAARPYEQALQQQQQLMFR